MVDIFDKVRGNNGPLGQYSKFGHGYFSFQNWKEIFLTK